MVSLSIHVYGIYHLISDSIYDILDAFFYFVAFSVIGARFFGRSNFSIPPKDWYFSKNILYVYFFLILSSVSCFYYHEQFPILTLLASRFFAFLLLYFLILALNIKIEFLTRIIYFFAIGYMLIFSTQLIAFPFEIVPLGRIEGFDRGFLRIRVEGVGFITLGGLLALNSFLVQKKVKYLIFFILCLLFVLLLGFRTLLATYLITCFFMTISLDKDIKNRVLKLLLFSIFVILFIQLPLVSDFIQEASLKTTSEITSKDENIRFQTFNFLFFQVNPTLISLLLGNGMAFAGTAYGQLILLYGVQIKGFISADIGLLGFAFNFGVLTLLAFLSIFLKAFKMHIPRQHYYLRFFPFYLFISSFTTAEAYRAGMFGVICICLVILTIVRYEKNRIY